MDRHEAYKLLQLKQLVTTFSVEPYETYEIKCRCLIPDWGTIQNIEDIDFSTWARIEAEFVMHAESTNAATVLVRRNGIAFESTRRHANYPTPFETCVLTWEELETIVECKTQAELDSKFSKALFKLPPPVTPITSYHFACANCQYSWWSNVAANIHCPLCHKVISSVPVRSKDNK